MQGTVDDNEFHTLDKYIAKNVEELYVDGNRTCIGYYLTADGNNELPMYLTIDLIENDDGTVTSILDISPDLYQLKFVETMNIFPPCGNNICADIKTTFSTKGIVIYESYRNRPQDRRPRTYRYP